MNRRANYRKRSSRAGVGPSASASRGIAPGRATLTDKLHVQRKRAAQRTQAESEKRDVGSIRDEASAGVSGGGGPLPHREAIQASFGSHDVGGIRAHVGGRAGSSAESIGAEAYATGDQVAFRKAPDLHTAAHEAAHVVQQRAGVQLKGGVGEAGDPYERHADAVADRVVRGQGAEALLDASPRGAGHGAVQGLFGGNDSDEDQEPGRIVSWMVDRIDDASELIDQLSSLSEGMARNVLDAIASIDRSLIVDFLLLSPTHRLAIYAARHLPVGEMVSLAVQGGELVIDVLFAAARQVGQAVIFLYELYLAVPELARAVAHSIETEHLPALLSRCAQLGYDLFHEWWPPNTGLEGQVSLKAGVKVPVWPAPPIVVGGEGERQAEIKLYNKSDDDGAPEVEFEVGLDATNEASVGLGVPEFGDVSANEQRSLAAAIKATTRFGEIDWDTGMIRALRGADREQAFLALCRGVGNMVGATQFGFTFEASMGRGVSAEAGLGDVAKAKAEQMMSLGLQLGIETPNENHDGKIEAEGTLTASMSKEIGADIPGLEHLPEVVGYFAANPSAGASGQAQIGGRICFKLPAAPLTEMKAPELDYVEFFLGGEVSARVAREQVEVAGEGSLRFTLDDLKNFSIPEISEGLTASDLSDALPFDQLGLKGSVELSTGLAPVMLRRIVARDNSAIQFLTGNPTATGKAEVEMAFEKTRIVALFVDLGIIRPDGAGADWEPSGAAPDALEALRSMDIRGLFAALQSAVRELGGFLWESLDKVSIDLHASTAFDSPSIPIKSAEVSGGLELRAGYTNDYSREQIEGGLQSVVDVLRAALPDEVAGLLGS